MIQSEGVPTAAAAEEEGQGRQSRFPLHLPRPRLGLEGGAPRSAAAAAAALASMSSQGAEPAKEEEEEEEGLSQIQGLGSIRCVAGLLIV